MAGWRGLHQDDNLHTRHQNQSSCTTCIARFAVQLQTGLFTCRQCSTWQCGLCRLALQGDGVAHPRICHRPDGRRQPADLPRIQLIHLARGTNSVTASGLVPDVTIVTSWGPLARTALEPCTMRPSLEPELAMHGEGCQQQADSSCDAAMAHGTELGYNGNLHAFTQQAGVMMT